MSRTPEPKAEPHPHAEPRPTPHAVAPPNELARLELLVALLIVDWLRNDRRHAAVAYPKAVALIEALGDDAGDLLALIKGTRP